MLKFAVAAAVLLAVTSAFAQSDPFQSNTGPAAAPAEVPRSVPHAVPAPAPRQSSSEAERAWAVTKDTTSTAILEAFAQRFAGTPYADMARARIQELKSTATGTPPPGAPAGAPGGAPGTLQSLGCFRDQATTHESLLGGTEGRDLNGYFVKETGMTVEHCVSLCREHGFAYAGLQFATQCFCGNSYGRSGAAQCDMLCAGNRGEVCGGVWANSVYRAR